MTPLTPAEITALLATLDTLSPAEQEAMLADLDALDKQRSLQGARDDFLLFCHRVYPGFKEGPHHRFMKPILHNVLSGAELRVTVSMPPRFGKALALDTEIPTPDRGFVPIGNLKVGDFVFAGDGSVTRVVGVSPTWRDREVCRVTTNDGYSVVADMEHEWDVVVDRKRPKWKTRDTRYVLHKTQNTKEARALRIPLQGAVQYPEKALCIHPYVLGVWLGDGRTDGAALCSADDFIFDKVNALEPGDFTEYATRGAARHWRPGPKGFRGDGACFKARLDVLGVTNNKHIPEAYLQGSVEQRLALLQGLVDTDGAVSVKGCVEFYNTNERLAYQVQELVQSLGTKAQVNSGPAMLKGVQYGTCWKVNFFMVGAASLPRKANRTRAATRTPERYIRAEKAGVADTVCIEVAHPSHLFLCTRGYIPTHNSETIAYLYVAWYLGHNPSHHIIMATHTADLSATFGRKIRDLIDSPGYAEIFPDTVVSKDKAAAANWLTTLGGKYLAIGIGANVAGHGAHLLIADDLVSENAMLANPEAAFENAWTYMQVGPLQRLMPGGRIIMIGTRWSKLDPIGKALQWAEDNPSSQQWLEVRFPAILPSGKSLWPEQWPLEQLLAKKAGMQAQYWSAQYQQEPTSEEGALVKREWWQIWKKEEPPEVEFIIQTWDTAHEAKTSADYSACTTWGVWQTEEGESRIILLDAIRGRWEFPDLKKKVLEAWKQWQPDSLIVEKKAAGAPLIQELRRMNIVVQETTPSRGSKAVSNDKYARMNSITDMFSSGLVWAPDKRWAHELIDEVAEFPFSDHDDYCFTANTKIILASGREKCILQLTAGDLVATPSGACVVVYCEMSNPDAEILEVVLSNGTTLRGTVGHPVYVPQAEAFIPLGQLTKGDRLCAPASRLKLFGTTGLTIVDTPTVIAPQSPGTSMGNATEKMRPFTARFGKTLRALFHQGTSYTTRTPTPQTTTCQILSASQRNSMASATASLTRPRKPCIHASGAEPTQKSTSLWSQLRSSASSVGGLSRLCKRTGPNTAPTNAATEHTALGRVPTGVWSAVSRLFRPPWRLSVHPNAASYTNDSGKKHDTSNGTPPEHLKNTRDAVHSAGVRSQPRALERAFVPTSVALSASEKPYVLGVRKLAAREPVYALKVSGNPVFYANGVLVHNCDCTQIALARYRDGGFIRLPQDYEDEDVVKRPRKANYG